MKKLLIGLLALGSISAFAEYDLDVCGVLRHEKSSDVDGYSYVIYYKPTDKNMSEYQYRFEIYTDEVASGQERYLKSIINKANRTAYYLPYVCVRGGFSGYFSETGYATWIDRFHDGGIAKEEKIIFSYKKFM